VTLGLVFVALPIATYFFLPHLAASPRLAPWIKTVYAVPSPGPAPMFHPWRTGDWTARDEAKAILAALPPRTMLISDPLRAETFRYLLAVDGTHPELQVLTPEAPELAERRAQRLKKKAERAAQLELPGAPKGPRRRAKKALVRRLHVERLEDATIVIE
jgi:hypothetical protein